MLVMKVPVAVIMAVDRAGTIIRSWRVTCTVFVWAGEDKSNLKKQLLVGGTACLLVGFRHSRHLLTYLSTAHRADEDVVVVEDLGLKVGEGDGEPVRVLDLMRCVEDRSVLGVACICGVRSDR